MHTSLRASVKLCAQRVPAFSPDPIVTLISLIWPNLAEIYACACKHIGCMHAGLHAWVTLCAQRGPACSPDSIDTLISLIWPDLAEILAKAHQKVMCMQSSMCACTCTDIIVMTGMSPQIHTYLYLSNRTQIGWDMGLCTQAHRVHACKLVWSGQTLCSDRSVMFSWFYRYFDLSVLN